MAPAKAVLALIPAAKVSGMCGRIIVSTNDEEIAALARWEGAETPFPRRQLFPPVYLLSGLVDVIRVSSALRNGALFAGDVRGYVAPVERSRELDTLADLPFFESALRTTDAPSPRHA